MAALSALALASAARASEPGPCGGAPALDRQYRVAVLKRDVEGLLALLGPKLQACDPDTLLDREIVAAALRRKGSDFRAALFDSRELRKRPGLEGLRRSLADRLSQPGLKASYRSEGSDACVSYRLPGLNEHEICAECKDGRWQLYSWPTLCYLD